jgi:hypothetical protein
VEQQVAFRAVLVALALCAACKDKQADKVAVVSPGPSPTPARTSQDAAKPAPQAAEPANEPPEPVTIEDAAAVLPKIEGTVVLALKQTSDKRQVHGTWCIDGTGADDVAKLVGRWMAEASFGDLAIRGDGRKAGVSGDRNGFRMSMVVSASGAASCAAPKHYFASATIFRP